MKKTEGEHSRSLILNYTSIIYSNQTLGNSAQCGLAICKDFHVVVTIYIYIYVTIYIYKILLTVKNPSKNVMLNLINIGEKQELL